jgi:hypothetical protein
VRIQGLLGNVDSHDGGVGRRVVVVHVNHLQRVLLVRYILFLGLVQLTSSVLVELDVVVSRLLQKVLQLRLAANGNTHENEYWEHHTEIKRHSPSRFISSCLILNHSVNKWSWKVSKEIIHQICKSICF